MTDLANLHRRKLNIPILAITGSNGKTTTKELCAAILGRKYSVLSTRGTERSDAPLHLQLGGTGPGVPAVLMAIENVVRVTSKL